MPSLDHEAIVDLFRCQPRLVSEVMRAAFDLGLPDAPGRAVESTLGEVLPTELKADLVVAVGDARVIVEVQLCKDDRKRWTWPAYAVTLRARERCNVFLLVVTNSPEVARWAKVPTPLGNPGFEFAPLVLGPENCPRITDPQIALRHPELVILTAFVRSGLGPDHDNLLAALEGAVQVGGDHGRLYFDWLLQAAGPLMEQIKEAIMATPHGYEFVSDFAREREAVGEARGEERGRIATTVRAVLKALDARGLPMSDAEREIILAATDLDTLERWHDEAFAVSSVAELLRAAPPSRQ